MTTLDWKKICCPIDFSDSSRGAVHVATELSRRFGADLLLLHVFQLPVYSFLDATVSPSVRSTEELLKRIDSLLEHWKNEAEKLGAARVLTTTGQGIPHVEIVRCARENNCDLIVMGTHGHTGIRHALIGSVAEKVIRTAGRAVLTVPP
ncbi:MAG TPA: universal stress protein [Myxococcaceae bacterium]|nr:universal stress protein [Myxococcaceae bacterium]